MEYTYRNLFQYFKQFLRPYRSRLVIGSVFRVVSAIFWLYSAYALASIVNFVSLYKGGDSLLPVYQILGLWMFTQLSSYILIYYSKMFCLTVGEQAALDVEKSALKHLSLVDISWHEKENSGNKVKRIQKGGDGVARLVQVWVVNIIDICVNIVGILFIISRFDHTLSVMIITYGIIYYIIATAFRSRTNAAQKKRNIKEEESTGLMFEVVNNIRSVKVLGMGSSLLEHVRKLNIEVFAKIKAVLFWYHTAMLARSTWVTTARILFLTFVVLGISRGQYQVGFLILFHGYFNMLSDSIDTLSSVAQDVAAAKVDVGRLADIFNEPITIDKEQGKVSFPTDWDGIHLRNLSFAYSKNAVLTDLTLDIKKGEKVGIVGLSGAGKSTLFKLLLKEHESIEKSIFIGAVALHDIKKSEYVQHVAAVLQDTEVFNMSVRENIVLANAQAEHDPVALQRAITISHVQDFLQKLPEGVETMIGEKGVKLSGGERQRLGIARAVFKNPEILFLDEATSHLDVESEQKIQDSLQHFFKDVTAVVIAHRLSTIREMDRIVVIEHGKILEIGTFDELHEKDGRFREFWDKQRS